MRWRQVLVTIAVFTLAALWGCSGSPTGPAYTSPSATVETQADSTSTTANDATLIQAPPRKPDGSKVDFELPSVSGSTGPVLIRRQSGGGLLDVLVEQLVLPLLGGLLINLDATVIVPPGALLSPALFSILIPNDHFYFYELGPHGSVFNLPVTLTISYANAEMAGVNESTLRIAYFNPSTNQWETAPSVRNPLLRTVTAQLSHFSAYGLVSDATTSSTKNKGEAK